MIAFLTIVYIAIIVLVFRVLKVKPRPWPIALFVVAGLILIGGVVVLWTLAAPLSRRVVVTRYVVQIVSLVKGKVLTIDAKPNVPLRKGKDVLFQIDPAPYQYDLEQARAQLSAAKANIQELEATVAAAGAAIKKARADVAATKFAYEADIQLQKQVPGSISELKVSQDTAKYGVARAELQQTQDQLDQATKALAAAKDSLPGLRAAVEIAQFNLSQCTITAPTDGYVTDWQIRQDSMVNTITAAAVGTFVDTSSTSVVAAYPAEQLIHVQPGQQVELAFKCRPGVLYRGKVDNVLQATGEGQFAPSGKLPSAAQIGSPGFLAVKIQLDDPEAAALLEMGAPGAAAIYTDWGKPFDVISKVAIRMEKWLYYLPIPTPP
jgi:multidrug resistance efflux pump